LRFTEDGNYLYALNGTTNPRLYKFNCDTGAEEWKVADGSLATYSMYVDASDNVYLMNYTGAAVDGEIMTINSDGKVTGQVSCAYLVRDIWIDEVNARAYVVGENTGVHFPDTDCICAINLDGTNLHYLTVTDAVQMFGVIKYGDYVYSVGTRSQHGIGGAYASVFKFDTELTLVASYDTKMEAQYIWVDWDGNIVVKSGNSGAGETSGLWLLDTDLGYIANYPITTDELYGAEGHIIPFMTEGTPGVPGTPGVEGVEPHWDTNDIGYHSAEVCVYADGIPHGTFDVNQSDTNDILLFTETDHNDIVAGINYYSIYESFPLSIGTSYGPIVTQKVQITDLRMDFHETMGCHLGVSIDKSSDLQFSEDNFATKIQPYTGPKIVSFPRGITREPILYLWEWCPVPLSVRALYPTANIDFEGVE
jgi:hypothetical protein